MNTNNYVRKAIMLLDAAQVEYAIIDNDGTVYDTLVDGPESKPVKAMYERGERTEYVKLHLKDLAAGCIAEVPFGGYEYEALRNSVNGVGFRQWGAGTHSIELDRDSKCFRVYRFE